MKTKFYSALFCLLFSFTFAAQAQYLRGEGPMVTKELQLETFSAIGLSIAADITITQGSQQKVVVKGQQNLIDHIKTDIDGNSWEIKFDRETKNYEKLFITITMESLHELAIAGSGNVKTTNTFKSNKNFELSISGSGDADLKVEAKDMECSIAGSGSARLNGQAENLEISIAGSGDVEAYDFQVRHCSVSTAGSGDAEIAVSEGLEASIVGSGDVHYNGDPRVDVSVIGSGKVRKTN